MCTKLKVKIKGKEHKVTLEEQINLPEEVIGLYIPRDKSIEIYKNLGKKKKAIVLVHELIHSIIHLTRKRYLTNRQEESIAYAISETLIEYLHKNPELLDKIVEGTKRRSKKVKYKNIKKN